MMKNILNFTLEKLKDDLLATLGEKPYRAKQIFRWIYEKRVYDFDKISDISLKTRDALKEHYFISLPTIFTKKVAKDGTVKILAEFEDGEKVESVIMRYRYGTAACISSQVGCNMNCAFCASGMLKKRRNLFTSEMVGQVLLLNKILEEENKGDRITHIVVMGTGEPFDNYENVVDFIYIMNEPFGLQIGARHITVSTCGLVPEIIKFSSLNLQVNLAISLHAPNDETRNMLMPINRAYPIAALMDAINTYVQKTNRRLTFEYILIKNVNDSLKDAKQLADLLHGLNCYVNLIPYNPIIEKPFERSEENSIKEFFEYLNKRRITCTIRKEFGSDIDAACGQLRAKVKE